jgi:ABC-type transport system substrate-binding protein
VLVLVAALLGGCSNTPPPPVVTTPVASSSAVPVATQSQIVVGVDDVIGGYNPHNLADASTITSALSQLLLPSVFRQKDDGTPQLDKNLMVSASVMSDLPFTVAYEISPAASWSDGAPIAAEDFDYLYRAMRDEPGVAGPAGYRLISGIQSRNGGKRVEVSFSKPYPGWQTLFSDLLPSHLLKDAPGGWKGALATSFPAVAGPFSVKTLDVGRGEVILERNDRYWQKPAAVDRLILRRADQAGLAAALRSGNDQFTIATTDANGLKTFNEMGAAVQLHTVARPLVADVLLRPVSATLADDQVRAGVAAVIDRAKLIAEGTAGGAAANLTADALVKPPSAPGYAPTIPSAGPPAAPDPAKAKSLFEAAGYVKETGTWRKAGKTLSLVIASPGKLEPYARMAKELSNQLIAAGIEVNVVSPQPRELFSTLLAMPVVNGLQQATPDAGGSVGVDIAVVPQSVDGGPATVLASTFGCRPGQSSKDKAKLVVPGNSAAFCDDSLQTTIDSALSDQTAQPGQATTPKALSALEAELWRRNVVIPLFQLADTLAIGSGISGVSTGPPMVGPFGSAVNWTRGAK